MRRSRLNRVRFRRTALPAFAGACVVALLAACSSSASPGPGASTSAAPSASSPSSSAAGSPAASLAPDANVQTIAAALQCMPSGAPSSASSGSGGIAGSTELNCTMSGAKYVLESFADQQSKDKALQLLAAIASGTGIAYCAAGNYVVGADIDTDNRLTQAQLTMQHQQLLTAHNALGCRIVKPRANVSTAITTPSHVSGAKLPDNAQAQAVAAKFGCSVTSHASGTSNGVQNSDVNCTKDGARYDIASFANAQGYAGRLKLQAVLGAQRDLQFCASGLWIVEALVDDDTSSSAPTQAQRAAQTKQMSAAHSTLGCTVRSL